MRQIAYDEHDDIRAEYRQRPTPAKNFGEREAHDDQRERKPECQESCDEEPIDRQIQSEQEDEWQSATRDIAAVRVEEERARQRENHQG